MNVIESSALGRCFGSTWALRECDLAVPQGHLVALVGPNGAGKSTLLNLVVGLTAPSEGEIRVLGGEPAGSPAARDGIAFVAQDMPLYRHYSVRDMLRLTRSLNHTFDIGFALCRVADLGIDTKKRVGRLSGGQRAQLALTLALARRPHLLVLDEPTAALDPVARHDFMATVMTAMAEDAVSVVLSSHVLAELERVADYLILISGGRIRLDGDVGSLLAQHRLLSGPTDLAVPGAAVIESKSAGARTHALTRIAAETPLPAGVESRAVGIEELAMGYLRHTAQPTTRPLTGVPR